MKRHPSRFRKVGGRVPPKWSSVPGRLLRLWPEHRLVCITLPDETEAGDLLLADRFSFHFERVLGSQVTRNSRGYVWRVEPWCVSHGRLALRPSTPTADPQAAAIARRMDWEDRQLEGCTPVRVQYPLPGEGSRITYVIGEGE